MLFRQIRIISNDFGRFNNYVIFVDIHGCNSKKEQLKSIVYDGFCFRGHQYILSERQPSMTRNSILSFIRKDISEEVNKRITMEIQFDKTVLQKYVGYRGLMFSSCHCLEGYLPKMIVVKDFKTIIKNQNIKYVYDEKLSFVDKEGRDREWVQKGIKQGVKDIKINAFDGCGICHPDIAKEISDIIGTSNFTQFMLRGPYIKGVLHQIDYTKFYKENNVEFIEDVWGVKHSIQDKMIILTESMYKGFNYFNITGTYQDWERYLYLFKKYQHCLGVPKWNFTKQEEPIYTRGNYQILQDLNLDYEQFRSLADYTINWIDNIVNGDIRTTYCFLGMMWDLHNPQTDYVKSILKNPEMLKEKTVRENIIQQIEKYIDDSKCGKLYLKGTFKILAPDLIALLEHIGGMEVNGCLESNEFWQNSIFGEHNGEYLIERNPHICRQEHTVLNAVTNNKIQKWLQHLSNVCMVNIKSLTPQRLNGADQQHSPVLQ